MKRIQSRRGNGKFTRNTLENTAGLHCIWCPACRIGNPWPVGGERPEKCHDCGVELEPRADRGESVEE